MEDFFFKALNITSWPGAVVVLAIIAYKMLPYFRSTHQGPRGVTGDTGARGDEADTADLKERMDDFDKFQYEMEHNHNTDLQSLLEWRTETDKFLRELNGKVEYIMGKIGNGHK